MSLATVRFDPRYRSAPAIAGVGDPAANADLLGAGSVDEPPTAGQAPSRAAVEAALARIVASRTFAHSGRHRAFLAYVTRAVLDGHRLRLKEVVIGLDIFGRNIDAYDPRRDSIVRVEARRLRKKLARYYATEGRHDPVRIRFEAGSYAPTFAPVVPRGDADAVRTTVIALPFRALDDAARPLALGLADHLVDAIGAIDRLSVIVAPPAVTRATCRSAAVASGQDVDFAIDGSVATSGSRLRCATHVTRSRDDARVWSQTFEFDVASADYDVFRAQDRIVEAIRDAIRKLTDG